MGIKVGTMIKEARTAKKIGQARLAELVGITSSELGKAEKGEKELSQDVLKKIAKEIGLTQKSLIDAAKEEAAPASDVGKIFSAVADALAEKKTAAKKAETKKTTAKKAETKKADTKKTEAKKADTKKAAAKKAETKKAEPAKKTAAKKAETAKKTATKKAEPAKKTAAKKTAAAKVELTAAEKKLVELYRAADSDTKKSAVALLKGESTGTGLVGELLGGLLKK